MGCQGPGELVGGASSSGWEESHLLLWLRCGAGQQGTIPALDNSPGCPSENLGFLLREASGGSSVIWAKALCHILLQATGAPGEPSHPQLCPQEISVSALLWDFGWVCLDYLD